MSLITKIILMVVGGLLIITVVLWFFFLNKQGGQLTTQTNQTNNQTTVLTNQQSSNLSPTKTSSNISLSDKITITVSPEEQIKNTLTRMAASFTERFGSYSNQSNYTNFEDLYDFMTEEMKSWAEKMVSDLRSRAKNSDIYFGITTKALSSKMTQFDAKADQAEVLVKSQRREASGSTANARIYYQDMVIKFVKKDGIWKVAGAFWQ